MTLKRLVCLSAASITIFIAAVVAAVTLQWTVTVDGWAQQPPRPAPMLNPFNMDASGVAKEPAQQKPREGRVRLPGSQEVVALAPAEPAPTTAADQARSYYEQLTAGNDGRAWELLTQMLQNYPEDHLTKLIKFHWLHQRAEGAEELSIVSYPVTELLRPVGHMDSSVLPAKPVLSTKVNEHLRELEAVVHAATPGIWEDDTGRRIGHLRGMETGANLSIIVSQTAAGHASVVALLDKLRGISRTRIVVTVHTVESKRPLPLDGESDFSWKELNPQEIESLLGLPAADGRVSTLPTLVLMNRGTKNMSVGREHDIPSISGPTVAGQQGSGLLMRAQANADRSRVHLLLSLLIGLGVPHDTLQSTVSEEIATDGGLLVPLSTFRVGPTILNRALLRDEGVSIPSAADNFKYLLICPEVMDMDKVPAQLLTEPDPPTLAPPTTMPRLGNP